MRLLFGHDDEVARYVGSKNARPFHSPVSTIGIVAPNGAIVGGIVFTGYNGDGVELSLAGRGVVSRGVWRAVLDYVFRQLRCSRLQVHTRRDNLKIRHMAPKAGFKFEGKARRFYGDCDGLCYSLTRDDVPAFVQRWRL